MGTGRYGNRLYMSDFGLAWSSDAAATAQRSGGMVGSSSKNDKGVGQVRDGERRNLKIEANQSMV